MAVAQLHNRLRAALALRFRNASFFTALAFYVRNTHTFTEGGEHRLDALGRSVKMFHAMITEEFFCPVVTIGFSGFWYRMKKNSLFST